MNNSDQITLLSAYGNADKMSENPYHSHVQRAHSPVHKKQKLDNSNHAADYQPLTDRWYEAKTSYNYHHTDNNPLMTWSDSSDSSLSVLGVAGMHRTNQFNQLQQFDQLQQFSHIQPTEYPIPFPQMGSHDHSMMVDATTHQSHWDYLATSTPVPSLPASWDAQNDRHLGLQGKSLASSRLAVDASSTSGNDVGCQHDQDELLCYGMLNDIETSLSVKRNYLGELPAISWNRSKWLQSASDGLDLLALSSRTHKILSTLVDVGQLELQFQLQENTAPPLVKAQQRNKEEDVDQISSLNVILYGSAETAAATGEWLSDINMYLQMPKACDRDVRYINPQCLSCNDHATMTSNIATVPSDVLQEKNPAGPGLVLDKLYTDIVYEECSQPVGVTSILHSHQKRALTFMLRREEGWSYDFGDVWMREVDSYRIIRYRNQLSGKSQTHPPKMFRGGILADEMGLGKTCSMLSLIAMNTAKPTDSGNHNNTQEDTIKATLIVVPFSLIGVWEKQICTHLVPERFKMCIYHGQAIQSVDLSLDHYDIVITTYNTLAHQWKDHRKMHEKHSRSYVFDFKWHRIVLDEAHVIRTRETANAKVVCAIRADRRWCITGTPIQNRLSDLYSLLRFLEVEPYAEYKVFDEEMLRPLKYGQDNALRKVQALMKAISIRRPKNVVTLPVAQNYVVTVYLSDAERSYYEKVRDSVLADIDLAVLEENTCGSAYISAFQRINVLRHICNHGTKSKSVSKKTPSRSEVNRSVFTDQLNRALMGTGDICTKCGADLLEAEQDSHGWLRVSKPRSRDIESLQLCSECLSNCDNTDSPTPSDSSDSSDTQTHQISTKIQALISHMQAVPAADKAVVFSYWTSTLDAIGAAFFTEGIQYDYFHGYLSKARRAQVLSNFSANSEIKVLLVSITCGGQGLDLTVANHAFLFEPQWNPMLEEQAMSRLHRLGQVKPVHLVRFIVHKTWEEKIRHLQKSKKNLAELIADRRMLKGGDEGKAQLFFLRELLM